MARLDGLRVAILVTNGFEEVEMTKPQDALDNEGAQTDIVSPERGPIKSWYFKEWGGDFDVDVTLDDANSNDYDVLLVPGGVMSPDTLRMNEKAVSFVRSFFDQGKPVASICHGPWMLIEADAVRGRRIASWPSLKTDLRNAGAEWMDEQAVVDGNVVTSRKPDDIPVFNQKMIELFERAARPKVAMAK